MKGVCRLCLSHKDLCDAHIIPRSFYASESAIVGLGNQHIKRSPIGLYDSTILCSDCDNMIGNKFDKPAKRILIEREGVIKKVQQERFPFQNTVFYRLSDKTMYEVISNFIVSVLWRASISTRHEVAKTQLGAYEDRAREVIWGNASAFDLGFAVALCSFSDIDIPMQLMPPITQRFEGVRFYTFIAGSIKIFVKADKQTAPEPIKSIMLSTSNDVLMVESKIKNVPEYKLFSALAEKLANYHNKNVRQL